MFARNGFQNVAEKIKLGRFVLERFTNTEMDRYTTAERLRLSFEQLGPTFVKLGQLLATRPDLIPEEFVEEFKKLHDQVSTVPFEQIKKVLRLELKADPATVFLEIDPVPMAAASIAQVHRAVLLDGSEVVVKVQRPGITDIIADDVNVLYFLSDLLQKYVPESRVFNPVGIVDEFFKSIEQETNFVIEANNLRRFAENFRNSEEIVIPKVYFEHSSQKLLVLERLEGIPLSQKSALDQEGINRGEVIAVGLRAYFKMVFKDGIFHADLHAGNIFILPNNRIGLIDFGIVGRLNRRTRDAIANLFLALYQEDYERFAYEYVDLAPYAGDVDLDRFARDLQGLLAPHFGLSTGKVDAGRLLMDSTAIAARHGLILPSELLLFFKSIVTIEGMSRLVLPDFNLLSYALEFASEIVKQRLDPRRMRDDMLVLGRESAGLLYHLPRQIKQCARKINSPDFAIRVSIQQMDELKRSIETSSNILFLGLIIGSLILSASLALFQNNSPLLFQLPVVSAIGYLLAAGLSLVAFYNYFKK